ncbi:MAG: cell wall-binding repeat-containing protein [Desulfitobacterium hafniense]|nr:cell wall-binding repeat-containing protein [Desulfitobacterium hafniense]
MHNKWVSWLLIIITLLTLVPALQPDRALSSEANTKNPDFAVISQKLESIAREKGIPSVILKSIAFKESTWRQWDSQGNPVLGSSTTHPAIGIMQVATYSDTDLETINRLKLDIDFNIRTGADILNSKWDMVPKIGDGDRNKLENWYFVLWAYNSWSGKNNPNQIATTVTTTESRTANIPYQDKVLAICAEPPGFLATYLNPVNITKINPLLLPSEGVPTVNTIWQTPTPVHYGDLRSSKPFNLIRIEGTDRIDTAIKQALAGWPQGANSVVLARADDFPDALSGVPLAADLNAPVLLTPSRAWDSRLDSVLLQLKPQKIYLLGGEGAIGKEISQKLSALGWPSEKQVRLGGLNRYATAAAIVSSMSAPSTEVVIATGENFPDALTVAAIAGQKNMPILLTASNALPEDTLQALKRLNPTKVHLVGGEGVISEGVKQKILTELKLAPASIIRLGGVNRYQTGAQVLKILTESSVRLAFATGGDFPDALAGASLAVRQKATLILLPKQALEEYPDLLGYIKELMPKAESAQVFGGEGAVSSQIETQILSLR